MIFSKSAIRYYVHGDLHEDRPNTYFCARCDAFVSPDHFSELKHVQTRVDKFKQSLEAWWQYAKRRDGKLYRPSDAENFIQKHVAEDLRTSRSAFYLWLLRQTRREDPIGDLASDASQDSKFPADVNQIEPLRFYLRQRRAVSEALVALDEAWDEFKSKGKLRAGIPLSLRFAILKRDQYRCQLCGATAQDGSRLEIDHKIAVAKGGSNQQTNLWVLCFPCNRGKSDGALTDS